MFRKTVSLFGFAAMALCTAQLPAEDLVLSQLYGSGVHRYFGGDMTNAHADFTAAIRGGTDDPRPYYFRALALMRMGRQYEAQADMQRGADLEAADMHGAFQVSRALERVQGGNRQTLERYRKSARAVAYERGERLRRERYTKARELDRARVRRAVASEPDPLVERPKARPMGRAMDDVAAPPRVPRGGVIEEPRAPGASDPFGGESPAAPAGDASPFGDAAPAPPGGGASPFGDDVAPPAPGADPAGAPGAPPPNAPSGADDNDPFGAASAAPAANDPFGGAAGAAASDAVVAPADPIRAETRAPASSAPATRPAESDPFGDAPGSTPERMPAEAGANPNRAPAAGDFDPFGAATPAADSAPASGDPAGSAPAASADPFGAAAAPADAAPAPDRAVAASGGSGGGAASGLFRAFGRVAEGETQGRARSWGGALGRYMPFGSKTEEVTIERATPRPLPPGAPFEGAPPPADAMPEGADPFGAPSPPPGAPAGGADPFGAAPAAGDAGEMKKEVKGDPFADDPVQPGESKSADNPFDAR